LRSVCTLLQLAAVAFGNQEEVVRPALKEGRVDLVLVDASIFAVALFDIILNIESLRYGS
jgi:hypothetical protein